jgi:glyoxylase-like metal-dependent hydrolase (beta-lactamase superfamily II)
LHRPKIICLTNGFFQENCYIVGDPDAREAVLIDPGEEADLFLRRLDTEGWILEAIWLTHAHLDHVQGVAQVVERMDVPVFLHPDDLPLYTTMSEQARRLGVRADATPPAARDLAGGQTLSVGRSSFEVRHVPGHSPGSVAFVTDGAAFVGDALFAGSVGRTDLPGGDAETLLTSIRDRLLTLPDDTVVYPGHGPETTIGRERAANPFLTGAVRIV